LVKIALEYTATWNPPDDNPDSATDFKVVKHHFVCPKVKTLKMHIVEFT